jgi:hypothetical protein
MRATYATDGYDVFVFSSFKDFKEQQEDNPMLKRITRDSARLLSRSCKIYKDGEEVEEL